MRQEAPSLIVEDSVAQHPELQCADFVESAHDLQLWNLIYEEVVVQDLAPHSGSDCLQETLKAGRASLENSGDLSYLLPLEVGPSCL